MRRLLKKTIQTSQELKEFRDNRLHHAMVDAKYPSGDLPDPFVLEADALVKDATDRLSFLEPAVKKRFGNDSVLMKVGIYSDQEYDLDKFARSLGFRNWKVAVIVYYALIMEDGRCGRR